MSLSQIALPAGFLLLFLTGLGTQVATGSRQLRRRREERFRTALDRHERVNFVDLSAPVELALRHAPEDRPSRAARLFGFDPSRPDLYPVSPMVAVSFSLLGASIIGMVGSLIVGRIGLLAVLPLWPVVGRMTFKRWHLKRAAILLGQFPDALAMVVRGVRVGVTIGEAIAAVSRDNEKPTSSEFARVAEQLAIGLPLNDALRMMADRNRLPEYRFFATALSLQSQTGGNLGDTLEGLADTIRKRVAARARGFALAAEARTSANVLAALPGLLFVALWFLNPHSVVTMLTEPSGHMILGATIVLLGAGMLAMRMLIQRSLS